jgi:hypothetical protein
MIIAFLQLRSPPILPALHQRQEKLKKKDGAKSEFADDMNKLSGFGAQNKAELGALLFQFFRFFAHEFDYDKHVLSVRQGKLLTKKEKFWHHANNNMLCVEEPFNVIRNLGNTADDTSFRGLHLELRRAFDLISEGDLDKCCELYVFPKEEERIFQKPHSQPRPALIRSSSQQQQSNRGGRGGGRGGRGQFHRNNMNGNGGNNNNNRRSSSVAYDSNASFVPTATAMTPQEVLWYQAQNPQLGVPQDVYNPMGIMATHDVRLQMYNAVQQMNQQQALIAAHAQRMQGQSSQATDRSRTNSFDNPPLTAPLRPDLVFSYGFPIQTAPYYSQAGGYTYPSSPSAAAAATIANGATEFRRSLHRGAVASDSSSSTGSGALRSQSQPASRTSMPTPQVIPSYKGSSQSQTVPAFAPRQHQAIPISFTSDEAPDGERDDTTPKTLTDSPPEEETRYPSYYSHSLLAFGDIAHVSQPRRRPSADQSPQTILDRRMRRTSRSPSPLGHARAFSMGTNSAPLTSVPFMQTTGGKLAAPNRAPLVVNGSGNKGLSTAMSNRQTGPNENSVVSTDDPSYDNPLHINQGMSYTNVWTQSPVIQQQAAIDQSPPMTHDRPLVANGSAAPSSASPAHNQNRSVPDPASFQQRISMMPTTMNHGLPYPSLSERHGLAGFSSSARSQVITRQQQNGIAPLDLATGEIKFTVAQDMQHLSPVYENRTPSPTVMRKFDAPPPVVTSQRGGNGKEQRNEAGQNGTPSHSKSSQTSPPLRSSPTSPYSPKQENGRVVVAQGENGQARSGRNQNESGAGAWQKPKNRKKTASDLKNAVNGTSHSEQLPKNDSDRRGG